MAQIGAVGGLGAGRVEAVRPAAAVDAEPEAPSRALVVLDGGRSERGPAAKPIRDGRAEAGFIAQLLAGADPSLLTSRLVRTRQAAARYAETARRLSA